MKKKITKVTSTLLMSTTMLFTTGAGVYSVEAADDDTFTVIHTNDMHGRLNEKDQDTGLTVLSKLKKYVESYDPDLLVDGGDAIQGLPMANLNKGEYMVDAMIEIGYDAMAVGNHEFDFGYDNLMEIKDKLASDDNMSILSSNVEKNGTLSFNPYDIFEKDGKKIAVIGFTTPETIGKTHPNNTEGVKFLDIETQAKKYIDEILDKNDDIDLILPVAHLGTDGETKDNERGDILSQKIADYLKDDKNSDIPVLFVDGHSHTEENDTFGRENLLYVQTGEHLKNIGHVEINFDDYTKSSAKLVSTKDLEGGPQLEAEKKAEEFFGDLADEIIIDDQPYHFNAQREYVRTRETNLGNLIGDAMIAYGNSLQNKPDLAVMNGGGIREDLEAGEVNRADVISIIPFGNTYASIEVTGETIKEMFEYSYRTPIQEDADGNYKKDENGNYILEPNGGFLQVSGNVKIEYDALKEPGERVQNIKILQNGSWEELQMDKFYTLATNDFLAQGGDGYDMLGGDRIEGDSLDDVFARFLQSGEVEWDLYKEELSQDRIIQVHGKSEEDEKEEEDKLAAEQVEEAIAALPNISVLALEDEETVKAARTAYEKLSDEAKALVSNLKDLEQLEKKLVELKELEAEEEKEEIPLTPLEPSTPVEEEDSKDEEEKEDDDKEGTLPKTGEAENNAAFAGATIIIIGFGGLVGANRKKFFN